MAGERCRAVFLLGAILSALWPVAVARGAAVETARWLREEAGLSAGIVCLPRCVDADLALGLAADDGMVVHAMSEDTALVRALRRRARSKGLLGRRLYVEPGSPQSIPFADSYVDLLALTDLTEDTLGEVDRAEVLRVLTPWRGIGILGGAADALPRAVLERWAEGFEGAETRVAENSRGNWVVVRKPIEPGWDDWTHRNHGPDNNLVSRDSTLEPPFLTQWLGRPTHEGYWGTTVVVAGGRMFTIWATRAFYGDNVSLIARSLHNGAVLWERPFTEEARQPYENERYNAGYNPGRCCAVATPEELYLADGDGILLLDAERGGELGRLQGPKPDGQIKWMAVTGGTIAVLAGERDQMKTSTLQSYPTNPEGRHIAVYEQSTQRRLWEMRTEGPVDERMIAAAGGRLYFHETGVATRCLDLKTGRELWRNGDSEFLAEADFRNPAQVKGMLPSQAALVATPQAVVVGCKWSRKLVALSPQDGKLLWQHPVGGWGRSLRAFAMDGKWWDRGGPIDLVTGETVSEQRLPSSGCGPNRGAPGYLFTQFGLCQYLSSGEIVARGESKPPCDAGTVLAAGMFFNPPSQCRCNLETLGYRVHTSGHGIRVHDAGDKAGRLVTGSHRVTTPVRARDGDWPAYRSGPERDGFTSAVVPGSPVGLWRREPEYPLDFEASSPGRPICTTRAARHEPTAPIAAGGLVWFGDESGAVHCLDAETGDLRWSFPGCAWLPAPPTLAEGRLYVAGGDGWVYCLDASTGQEIWRFRAAPRERRIMWYGHLISTWPVITGVLVHDGTTYFGAGHQAGNGVHFYAVDARTGEPVWENHSVGTGEPPDAVLKGDGVTGTLTVARGKLWFLGTTHGPVGLDLKTGKPAQPRGLPSREARRMRFRREIAPLGDRYLIYGGRRPVVGYDERTSPGKRNGFVLMPLDEEGRPAAEYEVMPLTDVTLPPAWDDDLFVTARLYNAALEGWETGGLLSHLDEWSTLEPHRGRITAIKEARRSRQGLSIPPAPMRRWGPIEGEASACVLTRNAVLVALAPEFYEEKPDRWEVRALDRNTGGVLWTEPLPAEPVLDGMCVDADGRILVALRDGSIVCLGVTRRVE